MVIAGSGLEKADIASEWAELDTNRSTIHSTRCVLMQQALALDYRLSLAYLDNYTI